MGLAPQLREVADRQGTHNHLGGGLGLPHLGGGQLDIGSGRSMVVYYPLCLLYVVIFFPLYALFAGGKPALNRMPSPPPGAPERTKALRMATAMAMA